MEPIDDSSALAVCDAGPLIHLDQLRGLDLLSGFLEVLIPKQVLAELSRHRPQATSSATFAALPTRVIAPKPLAPELRELARAFALDAGELEALAIQAVKPNAILLTDDSAARLAAKALGRRAHGTLGLLLRALRRGQRSRGQVLDLLAELPKRSTLHISTQLLAAVVREVTDFQE